MATRIGANDVFEQILHDHGLERDKLTFYAPMFEARYKSITQVIRKSGASQILELASGYSLRGSISRGVERSATSKRTCQTSSRPSSVRSTMSGSNMGLPRVPCTP